MTEEERSGSLAPGTVVGGRFKVDRVIGQGGMGEVYAAHHTTTSKEVALKVIRAGLGASADQTRRFMREARAATAIAHPNVIEVYDVFEDVDGTAVMVMELLKGETLSRFLERRHALELHEVATLLVPAMRALEAAHARGIVHRDLKPDNVFLVETSTGTITKVLDFGIAKILDPTGLGSDTQGQATSTGSLLGTPHYMSHEQAMSEKNIDARTDVWSMGVIVFQALTGRRPLEFENLGQMYKAFLQDEVPSIAAYVPDLPKDVSQALDACLTKHATERSPTLKPLADVLSNYTSADAPGARAGGSVVGQPGTAVTVETKSPVSTSLHREAPRASRGLWVALGVLAVGAGTLVAFSYGGTRQSASAETAPMSIAASTASTPASALVTTAASATPIIPSVDVQVPPRSGPRVEHPPIHAAGSSSAIVPVVPTVPSTTASVRHGIAEHDPYGSH